MTGQNLGIVFGPTLLSASADRLEDINIGRTPLTAGYCRNIVAFLVDNYGVLTAPLATPSELPTRFCDECGTPAVQADQVDASDCSASATSAGTRWTTSRSLRPSGCRSRLRKAQKPTMTCSTTSLPHR